MAVPNPKIDELSVTTVAIGAVLVHGALVALGHVTASGVPNPDGALLNWAVSTLMWSIVVLVDIFAFPRTRMIRLLGREPLVIAGFVTAAMTTVTVILGVVGESIQSNLHTAIQGMTAFFPTWAFASQWFFMLEKIRQRRLAETDPLNQTLAQNS